MNPALMLLLAILTPFLIITVLLGPLYGGFLASAYVIYDKGAAVHPLTGHLGDVFYIVDVYSQLFDVWLSHPKEANLWTYTTPLLSFPLIGSIIGLWVTRRLVKKLIDLFHLSSY